MLQRSFNPPFKNSCPNNWMIIIPSIALFVLVASLSSLSSLTPFGTYGGLNLTEVALSFGTASPEAADTNKSGFFNVVMI